MHKVFSAVVVCMSIAPTLGCRKAPPTESTVLFICEHGAAKSVLAAAYFNRLAVEHSLSVRAVARGGDPQPAPSLRTLDGLRADGFSPGSDTPAPVTASDVRAAVRIVAFDCDAPAVKPFHAMGTCWDDVPTVSEDYVRARDVVRKHVDALVAQLGTDSVLHEGEKPR